MKFTVTVDLADHHAALDAMGDRWVQATPRLVDNVLNRARRQAQVMLSLGWHPPGTRTGSAPGEPPWRISGRLRDNWRTDRAAPQGDYIWGGQVGPTTIYARIQELGGRAGKGHRATLPARPYLRPAWAIVRPTVGRNFAQGLADATRGA